LEMRHALTVALQDFAGALLVVSHDRHLLANTVDQFLLLRNGRLEPFEGDLADYEKLLLESNKAPANTASSGAGDAPDRKLARQQAAARREQLKPLRDKLRKVERELEQKQARLGQIETDLADPEIYAEAAKARLQGLLQEQGKLSAELEVLEEEWLSLSEALED